MPPLDKLQPLLVVKILRRACIVGCGDEQNERGMRGLVAHLARRTPPPLPSPPRSPSPPRRTRAAPEWKGHASPVAMSARRWRQCGRFPPLLRGDGRRALLACSPIHPPSARPPFLASYVKRRPQFWKVLGHTWYGRQPGFPSPPFASDVAAPASVLPASRRVRARRPASSRRVRSARVSVRPSPSVLSRKHGLRSWSFEVGHVFMTWVTNWARVNICLGHQ